MTKIKLAYGGAAPPRMSSIVLLLVVLFATLIDNRASLAQSLPSSGPPQSNASNSDCGPATGSLCGRPDYHLDRSEEDWSVAQLDNLLKTSDRDRFNRLIRRRCWMRMGEQGAHS